jgi:hypothetical protein
MRQALPHTIGQDLLLRRTQPLFPFVVLARERQQRDVALELRDQGNPANSVAARTWPSGSAHRFS